MTNTQHQIDRNHTLKRFAIVGFIIGALLAIAVLALEFVFPVWLPIMAPPEKAIQLLAYHNNDFEANTLYVRTVSGNVYAFRFLTYGTSDIEWRSVEQANADANNYECNFGKFSTPRPPGRMVSQLESHPCVLDSSSQVNYIILEDGSIWRWGKSVYEFEEIWVVFGLIVSVIIGGGLGVALGVLIGFVIVKFKKVGARS
jgi:hypothetical protein